MNFDEKKRQFWIEAKKCKRCNIQTGWQELCADHTIELNTIKDVYYR